MFNGKICHQIATRQVYGQALVDLGKKHPELVVMDAGMSNSTYSQLFQKAFPKRYFSMFIAEQNMVGVAVGIAKCGFIPFISTFASFLTRAHDQLRMASYSQVNIKICGSHAGVSIGQDGVSQMGLEDIAMFRSIYGSTVLYPSDGVSAIKLIKLAYQTPGLVYLRTTRATTPIIYDSKTEFTLGGVQIVKKNSHDKVAILTAGITLHEAIVAYNKLKQQNLNIRVVDLYCLKPLNSDKLIQALEGIRHVIVVEDHYPEGGLAEAVRSVLTNKNFTIASLAVRKLPRSGQPLELLAYEEIDSQAIINLVKKITVRDLVRQGGLDDSG